MSFESKKDRSAVIKSGQGVCPLNSGLNMAVKQPGSYRKKYQIQD